MAQSHLVSNSYENYYTLSDTTKVGVADGCRIEFVVTPIDIKVTSSKIHLTAKAWQALGSYHDRVTSALNEGTKLEENYHLNKVIQVNKFGSQWKVGLLCMGRKSILWGYSISLSEDEWKHLMLNVYQLNEDLKKITAVYCGKQVPKNTICMYKWKWMNIAGGELLATLADCGETKYFTESHAREMANMYKDHQPYLEMSDYDNCIISNEWCDIPDKVKWLDNMYKYFLKVKFEELKQLNCPVCQDPNGKGLGGLPHDVPDGCESHKYRDVVSFYKKKLKDVSLMIKDDTMIEAFNYCFKQMGLAGNHQIEQFLMSMHHYENLNEIVQELINFDLRVNDQFEVEEVKPNLMLFLDAYKHVYKISRVEVMSTAD
jgi:hypothetical protein